MLHVNMPLVSGTLSYLNKSILFRDPTLYIKKFADLCQGLMKWTGVITSAEPAPMRWVKCLTWDWWRMTSEKRCCLILSGHGNSHLLLGTINTAGPNTVSVADHAKCTITSFWIFVFCEFLKLTSDQITAHVCRAAEVWQRRWQIVILYMHIAYLVNCFLNFHWNDKISIAHWLLKKGMHTQI